MTLQDLTSVAEIIGAAAVVISLVYVGFQVKRNTIAIQSASFHGVTDSFNAINNLIAGDESTARIFRLGMNDQNSLTDDEKVRFHFIFMCPFRIFETIYFQTITGTVDPRLWKAEKRTMVHLLSDPGSLDWWNSNPMSFTSEFRAFVEAEIIGDSKNNESAT